MNNSETGGARTTPMCWSTLTPHQAWKRSTLKLMLESNSNVLELLKLMFESNSETRVCPTNSSRWSSLEQLNGRTAENARATPAGGVRSSDSDFRVRRSTLKRMLESNSETRVCPTHSSRWSAHRQLCDRATPAGGVRSVLRPNSSSRWSTFSAMPSLR